MLMRQFAVVAAAAIALILSVPTLVCAQSTDRLSQGPTAVYGHRGAAIVLRIDNDSIGSSGLLHALANDYLLTRHVHGAIAWYQDSDANALTQLHNGHVDMALLADHSLLHAALQQHEIPQPRELFASRIVLVGPRNNPAHLYGSDSMNEALFKIREYGEKRVAQGGAPIFLSRDDRSAMNEKEHSLWYDAGFTPWIGHDLWYRCDHVFARKALIDAHHEALYAITDYATWEAMSSRLPRMRLYVAHGHELYTSNVAVLRPYPSMRVQSFLRYLQSRRAQNIIARYQSS